MEGVTYKVKKARGSSQVSSVQGKLPLFNYLDPQKGDPISEKKFKIQEIGKLQEKESRITEKRVRFVDYVYRWKRRLRLRRPRITLLLRSNRGLTASTTRITRLRMVLLSTDLLDSIFGEEIQEDILQSPAAKKYELFDPFSGEKIHSRKKVYCSTDVRICQFNHTERARGVRLHLYWQR